MTDSILFVVNDFDLEKIKNFVYNNTVIKGECIFIGINDNEEETTKKLKEIIFKKKPFLIFLMGIQAKNTFIKESVELTHWHFQKIIKNMSNIGIKHILVPSFTFSYYEKRKMLDFLQTTLNGFFSQKEKLKLI